MIETNKFHDKRKVSVNQRNIDMIQIQRKAFFALKRVF